ncbi:hypothetical protein OIU84_025802 [Salix udensis]|uniref:Uncharacterized protein n=1 Tax=Salix udensis TaxID=889485 RepID=A0AAD6KKG0_9ROSI|nr:hypothetical protein OIU84_025802 [Salix udensis]
MEIEVSSRTLVCLLGKYGFCIFYVGGIICISWGCWLRVFFYIYSFLRVGFLGISFLVLSASLGGACAFSLPLHIPPVL